MTQAPPRSRLGIIFTISLLSWATALASAAQSSANLREGSTIAATGDVNAIHRKLSESIKQFQDKWRKAWRAAELKRHHPIDLNRLRGWIVQRNGEVLEPTWPGDRDLRALTPDLRRYEAMLCYIGSPSDRAIEAAKARTAFKIGTPKTTAEITAAASKRARANPSSARGAAAEARADSLARFETRARPGALASSVVLSGGVTTATARIIRPTPDLGAVCPSWSPENIPLQLDEGEAIDLALPPEGREPLRKAREILIKELEQAHLQYPNDEWIAGQRVRFVFDQRSPLRTAEAARACTGTSSLCISLIAFAAEQAGNIAAAEAAYHAAEARSESLAIEKSKSCVSEETLYLLHEADRNRLRAQTCTEQRASIDKMWWLADPLWSVPGNERCVAHESRRLHANLRSINDRDERYIWQREGGGQAMRQMVIRYGWPGYTYWPGNTFEDEINTWLENVTTRSVFMPHTAPEYSSDRTALIPAMDAILNPFELRASHYQLNLPAGVEPDDWWPQEHMMLFTKLTPLDAGQDAQWRRDTSIAFHLAIDDPLRVLDTAVTGPSRAFLMGGYSPEDTRIFSTTAVGEGQTLRFSSLFDSEPVVLSAEVLPRSLKEKGIRMRYGWHPPPTLSEMKPNDVALSDPLFLRMPNRSVLVPNDEKSVLRYMAGALSFTRSEPLGVYWESYGFKPGDSLEVSVTVRRNDDVSAARRLGAALGVVSALRDSIAVRWTEPDARHGLLVLNGTKPVVGRSIAVDLQALPPGKYVMVVEMRNYRQASARSERHFAIQ